MSISVAILVLAAADSSQGAKVPRWSVQVLSEGKQHFTLISRLSASPRLRYPAPRPTWLLGAQR